MPKFTLKVNGANQTVEAPASTPLLYSFAMTSACKAPTLAAASANAVRAQSFSMAMP